MRRSWITLLALLPLPVSAEIRPGDLLASEFEGGSIVNIRGGGGDYTGVPRFATGLTDPTDLCLGPGGDLYVAEYGGDLIVATAGGDLSAALPYATGLGGASGLTCTDSQILVSDPLGERIVDATAGGDLSAAPAFAEGLPFLADAFRTSDGTLYALIVLGQIFDVTAGGDFGTATPFATGLDTGSSLTEYGSRLLSADGDSGFILDVTEGGDFQTAAPFAFGLPVPQEILGVPGLGLYVGTTEGDAVFEVSAGGDFSSSTPYASGLGGPVLGLAYVPGCSDSLEQPGEECDDGNTVAGDGCSASCAYEPLCGDAPAKGCIAAAKARLTIDERVAGREKLALSLAKLAADVGAAELGSPDAPAMRYSACLYDGAGAGVGELQVARADELCGEKRCWKEKDEAYLVYKDPLAVEEGVNKIALKGGAGGTGKLTLSARNKAAKGQTALPALAAALAGETAARIQIATSVAACFDASIATVKRAEATLFKGTTP
jgi:cysteine-rich repeat protein